MKIIISPAKKMNRDTDSLEVRTLPVFLDKTEILMKWMKGLSREEAKALWKCNDKLTDLNFARFAGMDLGQGLTPAVISYEGIQYQYMAPSVMEERHHDYIQENLRILSGFYGVLKPFDGVAPYRLEMQAKAQVNDCKDLYEFWGEEIYRELTTEDSVILNLASKEYSKSVEPYLTKEDMFVTCVFGEWKEGKVIQKGTMAKMARGEMVRFLAERDAGCPEDAKAFDRRGYGFREELSADREYVFLKEG